MADLPGKNQVVINRIAKQRRGLRAVGDLLAIGFRRQRRDIRSSKKSPGGGAEQRGDNFQQGAFPQPEGPVISLNSPARAEIDIIRMTVSST
jgi:hypothetical protein